MKPRSRSVDYPLVIRSRGICAVIIIGIALVRAIITEDAGK